MSKRGLSLAKQATIKDVAEVVDDQPFCICLNPSLATVRLPIAEAGEQASTCCWIASQARAQTSSKRPYHVHSSCASQLARWPFQARDTISDYDTTRL